MLIRISISYWASLYCVFQIFTFLQIKVCGNSAFSNLSVSVLTQQVLTSCHSANCDNVRDISISFMIIICYCGLLSVIFEVIIVSVGEIATNLSINNSKITNNSCKCSCSTVGGGRVVVSLSLS